MTMQRYRSLAAVLVMAVLFTTAILFAQEAADPAEKPAAKPPATKKAPANDAAAETADENAAKPEKTEGDNTATADENKATPEENTATTEENKAPAEENAAPAEEKPSGPAKGSLEELWNNLLYFIKVAKPAEAQSFALGIVEKIKGGDKPEQLYKLTIKSSGWQLTLTRGAKLEGLAKPLAEVRKLIEAGYNVERANPEQIRLTIEKLGLGITAYELAVSRLKDSGEYAMEQLVAKLADPSTPLDLRERITNVLPRIGLPAVRPLSVALLSDNKNLQIICANALGTIGYPMAIPYLKDLADRPGVLQEVKDAANRAIAAMDDSATKKTCAQLFYELAEKYYYNAQSMTPDARYATANVWYWTGQGVKYKAVPREIFTDVYAMRNAALALKHDPAYSAAVSLWLAADFKREADLPKGAKDPTLVANEMTAKFYARAASAKYLQDVLARGLNDQNSAVAIGAIEALDETAGAKNLVASLPQSDGVQPLVKALTYQDRQVRYLAATTLAKSLPTEQFNGQDLVVPVLNEALRQTGAKRALLVVADAKVRNALKDAIRAAGYDVIDEPDAGKAISAARASAGVDVVVMAGDPGAMDFITKLRADQAFMALPAAVLNSTMEFGKFAKKDKRAVVIAKTDTASVTKALEEAVQLGAGQPLSPADATAWAVKSADAVRLLGLTNNPVLSAKATQASLIAALSGDKRGEVQIAVAGALAMMSDPAAQRAIVAQAITGKADEKVRVAILGSLSESVKKFGNQLTDEQAQSVLDLVNDVKASKDVRNAAAAVLGALNLPSDKIKTLIPIPAGI